MAGPLPADDCDHAIARMSPAAARQRYSVVTLRWLKSVCTNR